MSHVDELLTIIESRGEFVTLEDGYTFYWTSQRGALSAWEMRAIAGGLDKRNAEWDAEVKRGLGNAP